MIKKFILTILVISLILTCTVSAFGSTVCELGGSNSVCVNEDTILSLFISYEGHVTSLDIEIVKNKSLNLKDFVLRIDGTSNTEKDKITISDIDADSLSGSIADFYLTGLYIEKNGFFSVNYTIYDGDTAVSSGSAKKDLPVVCRTHTFSDWIYVTEAGCENEGLMTRRCGVCGQFEKWVIPALGHDLKNSVVIKDATCTSMGEVEGDCSRCGNHIDIMTPASEHSYGEWITDEDGRTSRVCSVCSDIEVKDDEYEDERNNETENDQKDDIPGTDIKEEKKQSASEVFSSLSLKKKLLLGAFAVCDIAIIAGIILIFRKRKK